jgi:MFS family permease
MNNTPLQTTGSGYWWRSLTPQHWFVYITCSMAWLFDSVDQQLFNLARDAAVEDLLGDKALATVYAPYTTSVFLVGWAIGGLMFGALGDRYGRAKMLTLSILLYSICTGLSAFATTYFQFNCYRLITGIGVGGVFGLAVALITDTLPDRARSPALGLLQGLSLWGNMAAGAIGMAVGMAAAVGALPGNLAPWQILFLVGAAPAVLSLLVFRYLKEPQAWLDARAEGERKGIKFGSYAVLLGHKRWRRHAWLGLALCSAGIIGLWGIGNFHPKIVRSIVETHLAAQGLSESALAAEKAYWSSLGLILQNAGGFFGMMFLAWFAQQYGRKPAFALGLVLSFSTTLLVFIAMRDINDIYWMIPVMGFGQLSVFALYAIYLPELFPTSLRSTGVSFCYNLGRLVAATAPVSIGFITQQLGSNIEGFRTAGIWVSLVLLLGLLALPFLPETKGQPLPNED